MLHPSLHWPCEDYEADGVLQGGAGEIAGPIQDASAFPVSPWKSTRRSKPILSRNRWRTRPAAPLSGLLAFHLCPISSTDLLTRVRNPADSIAFALVALLRPNLDAQICSRRISSGLSPTSKSSRSTRRQPRRTSSVSMVSTPYPPSPNLLPWSTARFPPALGSHGDPCLARHSTER